MNKKLFSIFIALFMGTLIFPPQPPATTTNILAKGFVSARIGTRIYQLEVADSFAEKSKGLSGREHMERGQGMLFVFRRTGNYKFTMQGMRFALDFIWLRKGVVVALTENASPSTTDPIFVKADHDRVIELNAGEINNSGVRPGDLIILRE